MKTFESAKKKMLAKYSFKMSELHFEKQHCLNRTEKDFMYDSLLR